MQAMANAAVKQAKVTSSRRHSFSDWKTMNLGKPLSYHWTMGRAQDSAVITDPLNHKPITGGHYSVQFPPITTPPAAPPVIHIQEPMPDIIKNSVPVYGPSGKPPLSSLKPSQDIRARRVSFSDTNPLAPTVNPRNQQLLPVRQAHEVPGRMTASTMVQPPPWTSSAPPPFMMSMGCTLLRGCPMCSSKGTLPLPNTPPLPLTPPPPIPPRPAQLWPQ